MSNRTRLIVLRRGLLFVVLLAALTTTFGFSTAAAFRFAWQGLLVDAGDCGCHVSDHRSPVSSSSAGHSTSRSGSWPTCRRISSQLTGGEEGRTVTPSAAYLMYSSGKPTKRSGLTRIVRRFPWSRPLSVSGFSIHTRYRDGGDPDFGFPHKRSYRGFADIATGDDLTETILTQLNGLK